MTDSATCAVDDATLAGDVARAAGDALVELRSSWVAQRRRWWDIEAGADRHAHDLIVEALGRARPDDAVLSEEGDDPRGRVGAERCWIVDPLDGSADFPDPACVTFAVHVALVEAGRAVAAAVSLPGIGAVHSTAEPAAGIVADRPPVIVGGRAVGGFTRQLAAALGGRAAIVGSAGVKSMAVVRGDADAWVHPGELWEWDSCAPAAVAAAAGLHVSTLDGSPLEFNRPRPVTPGLVIARPGLADAILELVA